jgi:hypothetical protein
MDLQLTMEMEGSLFLASVRGALSLESWQSLKQMCDTAQKQRAKAILIDVLGGSGILNTLNRFKMGEKLVEYCREQGMNQNSGCRTAPRIN